MATTLGLLCAFVTFLHVLGNAESRAVNISNTWILPQEGFPVFYRYFRDRISWYEADAVCQFHHANLVTVDTTAQYDAARAYLKELDIMSNVWIGLIKSNEEGDFSWTDYKPLSGEGYWGAAPGDGRAPLCAALDPAHDFRWAALSCGGPQVASFICELPVPAWAISETGGCLVRSLPSLTVQYLPELAAVRLASDCGLDGTRSVTCKPNEQHKDILKELSCFISDDDFSDNAVTAGVEAGVSSGSTSHRVGNWSPSPTIPSAGDYSSSTRLRRETPDTSTPLSIDTTTATVGFSQKATPNKSTDLPLQSKPIKDAQTTTTQLPTTIAKQLTTIKKLEITPVSENPTRASSTFTELPNKEKKHTSENVPTETITTGTETHIKENTLPISPLLDNTVEEPKPQHIDIYTQATDHFIPPLVMAKSKLSTDMTLVSAESKHHKAASHYPSVHLKNSQHIETTIPPIIHVKPTILKASDTIPPTKLDVMTTTLKPDSKIIEIAPKISKEIITTTLLAVDVTTVKPQESTTIKIKDEDIQSIKYKKPIKGKKYDKTKEEKKKLKEPITEPINPTTESMHKVVQVTLTNTLGTTTKPTIIDVTTKLPEVQTKIIEVTTTPKVVTSQIFTTTHPATERMIDPNMMKLNKEGTHNNDSEPIEQANLTTNSIKTNAVSTTQSSSNKTVATEMTTKPTVIENHHNSSSETETTETATDHSPEPLPRPNRSRLLTHPPQHRSFYPYFLNRVLG